MGPTGLSATDPFGTTKVKRGKEPHMPEQSTLSAA